MATFQEAISSAVRTQTARRGLQNKEVAKSMGLSRDAFWRRLSNRVPWDSEDFEKLAHSLGLATSWELLDLARQEQKLAA